MLMVDKNGRCNTIHYGSSRFKRVVRSVMADEIQALVLGFDYAYIVKDLAKEIIGRKLKMEALVDSRTVFNVVAKDGQSTEKRLQIDVLALHQINDEGELNRIAWIPRSENPADSLTKPVLKDTSPLLNIMQTNIFTIQPQGWEKSKQ